MQHNNVQYTRVYTHQPRITSSESEISIHKRNPGSPVQTHGLFSVSLGSLFNFFDSVAHTLGLLAIGCSYLSGEDYWVIQANTAEVITGP